METELSDYSTSEDFAKLLVGHRVTSDGDYTLTLDNGTRLIIEPNEGCGGCSAGWYDVDFLNGTDNAITSVEIEYGDEDTDVFTLFVYADSIRTELFQVTGDVGNGYYGSGFKIRVKKEGE